MPLYRKRPVEIRAIQWDGNNWMEVVNEFGPSPDYVYDPDSHSVMINTLEGQMRCRQGDWLIRGVRGEYYPCKPDIFESTYEEVDVL